MSRLPTHNRHTGEVNSLPSPSLLSQVAHTWAYRERVEHEAADQFARMASGLQLIGADPKVVQLAQKSALDEKRHAVLCRQLIEETAIPINFHTPHLGIALGPENLDLRKKILYACVSVSCITETLSTALLIEMQKLAATELVRSTVHSILEDEINHSRIGWAHLASEANHSDTKWLNEFIPGMLKDAMLGELPPGTANIAAEHLSGWGILPAQKAKEIMWRTTKEVILPGLRTFGISPEM